MKLIAVSLYVALIRHLKMTIAELMMDMPDDIGNEIENLQKCYVRLRSTVLSKFEIFVKLLQICRNLKEQQGGGWEA